MVKEMWTKNVDAISANKGCCCLQPLQPPPPLWALRGYRRESNRTLALSSQGAHQRHVPVNPDSCTLLYTERHWGHSLEMSVFMISSHLLMFNYMFFPFIYPDLFGTVTQSSLRGCIPGLCPQNVCQVKHSSQLIGCTYFLVDSNIFVRKRRHWMDRIEN